MKHRLKVTWVSGEVTFTRPFVTRWAAEKKAKALMRKHTKALKRYKDMKAQGNLACDCLAAKFRGNSRRL